MSDNYLDAAVQRLQHSLQQAEFALRQSRAELDNLRGEVAARRAPRTYYSIAEACEALRISRSTLNRRMNDGTIPTIRIEGRRLIAATTIDNLTETRAA